MAGDQGSADAFAAIAAALIDEPDIGEGTGFGGSGGLRVDGRIFAMLTADELVVKLPAIRVAGLLGEDGVRSFVVGRRTMREWVCVRPGGAHDWESLAREALAYVRGG